MTATLDEAARALRDALRNKGSHPGHHDDIEREVRRVWPSLMHAVDQVCDAIEAPAEPEPEGMVSGFYARRAERT